MNYDALHTEILCGCEKRCGHGLKRGGKNRDRRRRGGVAGEASGCRGSLDFTYKCRESWGCNVQHGTVVIILCSHLKVTKRADFKVHFVRK